MSHEFPEFVYAEAGQEYLTGLLPRMTRCGELPFAPMWRGEHSKCPILPRNEWGTAPDVIEHLKSLPVDEDQNGDPSCTATSLATDGILYEHVHGREILPLDWYKLWVTLTGGSGGIALDHCLRHVEQHGFPIKGGGSIKPVEVWDIPDIEAAGSAVTLGYWLWAGRFVGRGGHAECSPIAVMKNGKATFWVRGTWGRGYGENGWYPVAEADYARGIKYFGAFAIRAWELRTGDLTAA